MPGVCKCLLKVTFSGGKKVEKGIVMNGHKAANALLHKCSQLQCLLGPYRKPRYRGNYRLIHELLSQYSDYTVSQTKLPGYCLKKLETSLYGWQSNSFAQPLPFDNTKKP